VERLNPRNVVEEFKERAYGRLEKARLYPVLLDKYYSAVRYYRVVSSLARLGAEFYRIEGVLEDGWHPIKPRYLKLFSYSNNDLYYKDGYLFIQPIPNRRIYVYAGEPETLVEHNSDRVWVEGDVLKKILRYRSLLLRRHCIPMWEGLDADNLDGLLFVRFPFNEKGFKYFGPSFFSPSHDAVYIRREGEEEVKLNNKEDVDFTVFDRAIRQKTPVRGLLCFGDMQ